MKSKWDQRPKSAACLAALCLFSVILCFLFVTLGFPYPAQAAPGDLDTIGFGTGGGGGGIVTTPIGTSDDEVSAVAIQTDGKLVAAGVSDNGTQYVLALARYNTDGSLDMTVIATAKVFTAIGTL